MAKPRDYKAEYARRVAGVPVGKRSEARGHSGPVRRFLRDLKDGDIVLCDVDKALKTWSPVRNWFGVVDKWIIGAGDEGGRLYRLRNVSMERMERLVDEEEARGALLSPVGSLDQRALLREF